MALNFDLSTTQSIDQIVKYIEIGCVPEVPANENLMYCRANKLLGHLETAKAVLNELNNLLSKLLANNVDIQVNLRDIMNSCLYLCGEHCQSNFQWSDNQCHSIMNSCIEKLCSLMHYTNIEELFTNVNISKIVLGLKYKLEHNNWKKYPAAVECFMWILKHLKLPHLHSILYLLMPLPLNMFDDYQDTNKIIALDAIQHIINNTPAAELAMSGYDTVLLESFECGLKSSEYQIIPHLLKCHLSLISKMQMKHLSKKNYLEWTKFDDVMSILLPRMELEHKNGPTECYSSILPFVLESIGFSSIRWSGRLIPLFAVYVTHSYSTLATLKAIEVFIKQTWPRIDTNWNVLLTTLIKVLYNESKMDSQPDMRNISAIEECFRVLEAIRPECLRNTLNKLIESKELKSKNNCIDFLKIYLDK